MGTSELLLCGFLERGLEVPVFSSKWIMLFRFSYNQF